MKPHQSSLLIAGGVTLAAYVVPGVRLLLLPLLYLNTHLHEMSHALAAVLTGADVQRIVVNTDGSGMTPVQGGNILVVASAGYLGASMFGAAMIYAGRTEKGAKSMLWALSALLIVSMLLWVRGDAVGEAAGIGWIVLLGILAATLKGKWAMFGAQFFGLQQCLNAVTSVFTLVQLSVGTEVHSDATILYDATGLPPVLWAVGWTAFSLGLVGWTLRETWNPKLRRAG